MDDLSEKLAGILNDPESMNRVKQMAESILGNNQPSLPATTENDGLNGLLGADEMQTIIKLITKFKNSGPDPRSQLLTALKPHLSEPRREKVETAIKILKIIELLPLLKDSGILNF